MNLELLCVCCRDRSFFHDPLEFALARCSNFFQGFSLSTFVAATPPRAMASETWQYKFVSSECHDPEETLRLFSSSSGWSKLGPVASERCQNAMMDPRVGLAFFMTLNPMIGFKFHLVGQCQLGITLCRLNRDAGAGVRCIAKPVNEAAITLTVEVVPDGDTSCFVHFYSIAGGLKLTLVNKSLRCRWGVLLREAGAQMGRTNLGGPKIKWVSIEGIELTMEYHQDCIGDKLKKKECGPKTVRGKFSKK